MKLTMSFFKAINKLSKKIILLSFLILFCNMITSAQKYFQQDVKYNINVKLNDVKHELSAFESIVYKNNSPNELNVLYFHIWPNAYRNTNTAMAKQLFENGQSFFYYSDDSLKGYIDSLDFKINDKVVKWEFDSANIDICKIILNEPLKPNQSVTITTPFHVKIPSSSISRLGHEGQSYQISQWFPKPAVYDANGWNAMPYLNMGEFYSEYGSFDVYITLPQNYIIGSTGDLVNNEKENKWLDSIANATLKITNFDNKDTAFPISSTQTKTLHYYQDKIHDFAWFADKRYHILKGEVELPVSKRKVNTYVMFTNNEAHLWKNSIPYINDAIYYYSKWIGEYPYKHATAIEGAISVRGGGMEYPNINVITSAGDSVSLEMLIIHEVGHNWFYGILGSNERRYPYMDEGINSFYEYRYLQTKHPGSLIFYNQFRNLISIPKHAERSERSLIYDIASHLNNDQAISLPSESYTSLNYMGITYEKSAVAFSLLKEYLGEETFDNAMKDYFNKWKYSHPQPENLKNVIESYTGKNLSWFFDDIINTTKKIDYKFCSVKKVNDLYGDDNKNLEIKIKNKGQISAPFEIITLKNDSICSKKWFEGFSGKKRIFIPYDNSNKILINSENNTPEFNRKNNFIRTSGLHKKTKPLKIHLLPAIDDPLHSQISITPMIGFNLNNGFMAGFAAYNNLLPQKKFSYMFLPLYGTSNNGFAGFSRAGYTILPSYSYLQLIWIGASYSRYSYSQDPFNLDFDKLAPEIFVKFKNSNFRSSISSSLRFRNVNISKDIVSYASSNSENTAFKDNSSYYVNELKYEFLNNRKINPFKINIAAEQSDKFVKAYMETFYRVSYDAPRKGLDIRAFFGDFLY